MSSPRIARVLVANRGEIAVRIIRSLRTMGVETVAVYSEIDRQELHVRLADRAVALGPPTPSASYLNIERVIEAATSTGCDAIHPGYGFLSENERFARAVACAGLTFIGPSARSIALAGDKLAARRAMSEAGVPVLPGSLEPHDDASALLAEASSLHYPVAVKAVGGGGGRGIRIVGSEAEMPDAIATASSEAAAAFGNAELYLETYLESARHVEVQVVADQHGNRIHLGERECSVQRRHQKLVEESPSPAVSPELRDRLGRAALAAAGAFDYVGIGTVEFLVDDAGDFYFLEMNTRIQVEHPVTELRYGVDLVEQQVRIAEGAVAPWAGAVGEPVGHAVEVRLTAEDGSAGFLPCTGTVESLCLPSGPGIRIDSHLFTGQQITTYYDPLLAKIIAFGPDRDTAIARLACALGELRLCGVTHTAPTLRRILMHPRFRAGDVTTRFLEEPEVSEALAHEPDADASLPQVIAAVLYAHRRSEHRRAVVEERAGSPWAEVGRRESLR